MRTANAFRLFSQIINFVILIYFVIVLLRLNALDLFGLLISAFGLLVSLLANIISALEVN